MGSTSISEQDQYATGLSVLSSCSCSRTHTIFLSQASASTVKFLCKSDSSSTVGSVKFALSVSKTAIYLLFNLSNACVLPLQTFLSSRQAAQARLCTEQWNAVHKRKKNLDYVRVWERCSPHREGNLLFNTSRWPERWTWPIWSMLLKKTRLFQVWCYAGVFW